MLYYYYSNNLHCKGCFALKRIFRLDFPTGILKLRPGEVNVFPLVAAHAARTTVPAMIERLSLIVGNAENLANLFRILNTHFHIRTVIPIGVLGVRIGERVRLLDMNLELLSIGLDDDLVLLRVIGIHASEFSEFGISVEALMTNKATFASHNHLHVNRLLLQTQKT